MTPSGMIRGAFTEDGCPGKLQAVGIASMNVNKRNSIMHLQNYKWSAVAEGGRRVRYGAELEMEAGPNYKELCLSGSIACALSCRLRFLTL